MLNIITVVLTLSLIFQIHTETETGLKAAKSEK